MKQIALICVAVWAWQVSAGGVLTGVNTAVTITSPTSASTYDAGTSSAVALSGSATSDRLVTGCTWTNSLGGSGTATGTTSWSIASVALTVGSNVITVSCLNAAGVTGADTLTVTRSGSVSNPIAAIRMPGGEATLPNPTWVAAGAGTIPARTTACSTLGTSGGTVATSQSVTASQINTAITGCASGQTVLLNPGTYTLNAGLTIKSNITLRGSGPNQTKLLFTGGAVGANTPAYIFFDGPNADGEPCCTDAEGTWTAGYSQGTTSITLGAITKGTKPVVGTILNLDQIVDGTTAAADRYPDPFSCQTVGVCTIEGGSAYSGRGNREPFQMVRVTAISGGSCPCTVTITPAINMPNQWRSGQTPGMFWVTQSNTKNSGVEDLWIESTTGDDTSNIVFKNNSFNWMKNVKSVRNFGGITSSSLKNTLLYGASNITVRDSYFFNGTEPASQDAYGVDCFTSGNSLIENNIFQKMRVPIVGEQCEGLVNVYNYAIHMATNDGDGWDFAGVNDNHGNGANYWLVEGNDDTMSNFENTKGTAQFAMIVRNNFIGHDAANGVFQQATIFVYGYSRYANILGNVLGVVGWHDQYETNPDVSDANCNKSIYALGLGDNCAHGGTGAHPPDDPHATSTHLRWGNWDTVTSTNETSTNDTAGIKWSSSEVPTGLTTYGNTVPSSQVVPISFLYSSTPSWWPSCVPFPPIGPDVTSGDIASRGGHANRNPARRMFEDIMGGAWGDTTARTFVGWKAATGC